MFGALALLGVVASCNSKGSIDHAKDVNDAKVESTAANTNMGGTEKEGMEYDAEFLAKAASGGMLKAAMGKAVLKRAVTPQAKWFAQKMVSDHEKSNAELKALAAKRNLAIPTTMADEQSSTYRDVMEKKDVKMDQDYVDGIIKDHQDDVKELTNASAKVSDSEIKAFATKNVPVLQMYLSIVTKIQPTVDVHK